MPMPEDMPEKTPNIYFAAIEWLLPWLVLW
jgi:hypothetical protein